MPNLLAILLAFLSITKVECYSQFGPCPESLVSRLEIVKGQSILKPLPRQQLSELISSDPSVVSVEFYRRIPHTIVASVMLRKPIGVVGARVLGMVDNEGIVIGETQESSLPQLIYTSDFQTGDRLPADHVRALTVLSKIYAISGSKNKGELAGQVLTATTDSGMQIIIDISRPDSTWDASLQAILARSKIDGKRIRKLDLRYLNPIVVY